MEQTATICYPAYWMRYKKLAKSAERIKNKLSPALRPSGIADALGVLQGIAIE
jgi:hypothetical protein